MNGNLYNARVRATYKKLVKALGLISWHEVVAVESRLAELHAELILDGDADKKSRKGKTRYLKVNNSCSGVTFVTILVVVEYNIISGIIFVIMLLLCSLYS